MHPKAEEDLINVRDKLGDTARGLIIYIVELVQLVPPRNMALKPLKDAEFILWNIFGRLLCEENPTTYDRMNQFNHCYLMFNIMAFSTTPIKTSLSANTA